VIGNDIIALIGEGRRQNNILWMKLLEIALSHAPAETKAVLQQINKNDATISALLAELAQ
jgi:hypothetical protein